MDLLTDELVLSKPVRQINLSEYLDSLKESLEEEVKKNTIEDIADLVLKF